MHRAIIFQGTAVAAAVVLIFFMEGKQTRRSADERAQAHLSLPSHEMVEPQICDSMVDVDSREYTKNTTSVLRIS